MKDTSLKIVKGAYYKKADGVIVGPAFFDKSDTEFPWNLPNQAGGDHWYRSDGTSCLNREGDRLVSRVTTKKQPKPYTAKASITVPADYLKAEKWRRLALRMSKAKTIRDARKIYNKGVGRSSDNASTGATTGPRPKGGRDEQL